MNLFFHRKGHLAATLNHATKLLVELDWIKDHFSNENPEFFVDFLVSFSKTEIYPRHLSVARFKKTIFIINSQRLYSMFV